MISEQSLEGWDNNSVKFSNVKYPETKDDNAPKNFFSGYLLWFTWFW